MSFANMEALKTNIEHRKEEVGHFGYGGYGYYGGYNTVDTTFAAPVTTTTITTTILFSALQLQEQK